MSDQEQPKVISLTYNQPQAWAQLDENSNLIAFSLIECMKASQSNGVEVATYASVILQVIKIVCDDEEKLSELLEFNKNAPSSPQANEEE